MKRPGLLILLVILLALLLSNTGSIVDTIHESDYSEYIGLTGCTGYGAGHRFGGGSSRGAGNGGRY